MEKTELKIKKKRGRGWPTDWFQSTYYVPTYLPTYLPTHLPTYPLLTMF